MAYHQQQKGYPQQNTIYVQQNPAPIQQSMNLTVFHFLVSPTRSGKFYPFRKKLRMFPNQFTTEPFQSV